MPAFLYMLQDRYRLTTALWNPPPPSYDVVPATSMFPPKWERPVVEPFPTKMERGMLLDLQSQKELILRKNYLHMLTTKLKFLNPPVHTHNELKIVDNLLTLHTLEDPLILSHSLDNKHAKPPHYKSKIKKYTSCYGRRRTTRPGSET